MSAINKTGVVRYNVTTDTHGYPWGHRHGVNGTTIHFDLGDNTVGCNLGELDPPEAMSVEANIALRGNHDTAVMGWDKDEPDEKGGFHLELQTYNDPDNKIAVFGLDVGTKLTSTLEIPAKQIYQLAAALSRLDNGWDVIILTHAPLFPGTLKEVAGWNCGYCWGRPGDSEIDKTGTYAEDAEKVITLLNAFKEHKKYSGDNGTIYDFSSSNGRVLGCFAGHIHNSAKVIYKGIPMEAFPTNGADEWTPEKRGSHSNMGLYKPVLSYININFDSKTVNGQSFIHTDSNLCEVTGIGDYYHNESSCFYLDKVSGYFHMQPSPAAHPKFYDGIYLGYSGSPLDGTSFGKNVAQDRYWPFDASIDMKIGARMVQAKGIWFDTNGRLRYYTNSSDTSNYKSYIPIEDYRSVKITFTTHNVSWTFQDGLLVSSVPVYKSGSFIGKNHALAGESVRVCALDTLVAFCSGLIIFPSAFAFGVNPGQGPSLIFVTLPNVFNAMPGGQLWGALFFVFLFFAALSTVTAVFENILACWMDRFGISRGRAVLANLVLIFLLSLPCLLGYNLWSNFRPIAGRDVLDSEDFLVSNLLLPLGSLLFIIFCTTRYGWGWENFLAEANEGKGLKIAKWLRPYMTYVLPVIVGIILVFGLYNFFAA